MIRHHFQTIRSTNQWAKEQVHRLDKEQITLITANEQTEGTGQFKRPWLSPPHLNLYVSFCFFRDWEQNKINEIPQRLALCVIKILEEMGIQGVLKMPNDILVSNKKIAGILTETIPINDERCIIVGLGLNVNMPDDQLQKIDQPATSILHKIGKKTDLELLLHKLTKFFRYSLDE